jgi:(+)-neomenthol dehydrogenase
LLTPNYLNVHHIFEVLMNLNCNFNFIGILCYLVYVFNQIPLTKFALSLIFMLNQCVSNEWAKGVFSDVENLTEERIDEVLKEFIKDFEEGSLERKVWPRFATAYIVAKASMNAYTRIIAKKYPCFCINCVCPGYVKTDITANTGIFTAAEGAANPVRLALLPNGSASGLFYGENGISSF